MAFARIATTLEAPSSRASAGYVVASAGLAADARRNAAFIFLTTTRPSFHAIRSRDWTYVVQAVASDSAVVHAAATARRRASSSAGGAVMPNTAP